MPSPSTFLKAVEKTCKALGNGKRLAILRFLAGRRSASVSSIADHIGLSLKSTSKHLLHLQKLDIVDQNRSGKFILYRIGDKPSPLLALVLRLLR